MSDKEAQLAILADALTKIVDMATVGPATTMPAGDFLARTGDLAAQALAAAATYGPLPAPALLLTRAEETRQERSGDKNPR